MKPAAFDYVRAESANEVVGLLAKEAGDDARLAGGQSLMAMLNMRLARPSVLVDIMRIAALAEISETKDGVAIGAGVRQATLLAWPMLKQKLPLVALMLPWTGHVQTRSRGTICGSVGHADPSAETPLALVALNGTVVLRNAKRRREVKGEDFFTGMMSTARQPDEMIEKIVLPQPRGEGFAFREVARRHGDFAIVACAAIVRADAIRLAVGGVADRPMARDWPMLEGSALDDALNAFAYELGARDDFHATARYRRDLVRAMGRAVIEEARRCRA